MNVERVLELIEHYGNVQFNAGHASAVGRLASQGRSTSRAIELYAQIRTHLRLAEVSGPDADDVRERIALALQERIPTNPLTIADARVQGAWRDAARLVVELDVTGAIKCPTCGGFWTVEHRRPGVQPAFGCTDGWHVANYRRPRVEAQTDA